jgi:hypothetical protein
VELERLHASFVRGHVAPRGVTWLGFRSFWGHLRHLAASAIATEDIDSRDWMTPDDPRELCARAAAILGVEGGDDLVEALGRDLWIDFVADTGDDVSVSRAVARLVAADYELPDPARPGEHLSAPRGDVLLFGGDTAYPVATAEEIHNRVLVPFNEELAERRDGRERVLLGIPGNHDWYDGLDGFARMFRRRDDEDEAEARPSVVAISRRRLERVAEWTRELVLGGKVDKPVFLVLDGYVPVQNASYFALPLSRAIHLVAVDRQLKTVDERQRRFHRRWLAAHDEAAPWVLLPDPLFSFGAASATGSAAVRALELDFGARSHFLLSGDIHHYERIEEEGLLHVVAGGGGAFLHPAPMVAGRRKPRIRWPSVAQSRALLWLVPIKIALGRSGYIPHAVLATLFAPAMLVGMRVYERAGVLVTAPVAITLALGLILALLGGLRRRPVAVVGLAGSISAAVALVPIVASLGIVRLLSLWEDHPPLWAVAGLTYLAAILVGTWLVGLYLALLTRLGLEETQAFTTLDHPGFKHFLRLRVRKDGEHVDGWCIGLTDPLREGEQPVLVDHFTWSPHAPTSEP